MLGLLDKNGLESVAAYRTATILTMVMMIPYKAMTSASLTVMNDAYINNDKIRLKDLFHRSGINILIVGVAMFYTYFL